MEQGLFASAVQKFIVMRLFHKLNFLKKYTLRI